MLLWTTLLCLLSIDLAVSQAVQPDILLNSGQSTALQPLKDKMQNKDSTDNVHLIRGLLTVRQSGCPTDYAECTNPAGRCCPLDSSCCQTDGCCQNGYYCYSTGCCLNSDIGCEEISCCSPGQTCCNGGGCCDPGYTCTVVNGQRGCCANGSTCTDTPPQCTTAGYVPCPGEDFCCPSGYQCFRDSTNTPKCSPSSSGVQPSLTNTNVDTNSSTVTFVSPSTISLTQGPSTVVLPSTTSTFSRTTFFPSPSSPSPSTTSGNAGLTSSALPVGVDTLLNLLAGVGVFAYLF